MLSDLDFKQEAMEDEMETNILDQMMKHEDLQLEILKLEAALNMTVSHWKELKSGHSEFADKTLDMLKDILDMASTPVTESNKDDNIDDVEVIEDEEVELTTRSSDESTTQSSIPKFYNCSNVRKFSAKEISCNASSEFDRRYSCMKAFDGVLAMGRKKSSWASRGEGVGAWIHAKFNKMKAVNQIKLLQRVFPGEANRKVEIQFGGSGLIINSI